MATIDSKRFTKFRLQLELLASHTSYSPEDFVFKYSYNGVVLPTTNYGDIILHEVRYKNGEYFWIEYYIGSVLDFVFYIVAYRYRRYGKEIVNYYEVCHKL